MSLKNILSLVLFILSAWCFSQAMWYWKSKPLLCGIGLMLIVFLLGE